MISEIKVTIIISQISSTGEQNVEETIGIAPDEKPKGIHYIKGSCFSKENEKEKEKERKNE